MSGNPEREGGGGGGATLQHGNPNSRFHISEFPVPLRGSAEGPQNPDFMFPSVQIPRYSSANSRFRVSEFPRFQGPSVGPRREPNFQIPCFLVGRFQDTPPQIPDSKIPSVQIPGYSWANSRFRVSEFPAPQPHVGPSRREHPKFQIPSFRVCSFLGPFTGPRRRGPKFQIPSFRVSGDPSRVRAGGTPNSRFRVSEFPGALYSYLHVELT